MLNTLCLLINCYFSQTDNASVENEPYLTNAGSESPRSNSSSKKSEYFNQHTNSENVPVINANETFESDQNNYQIPNNTFCGCNNNGQQSNNGWMKCSPNCCWYSYTNCTYWNPLNKMYPNYQ